MVHTHPHNTHYTRPPPPQPHAPPPPPPPPPPKPKSFPPYHTVKAIVETLLGVALPVADPVLEELPAVLAVDGLGAVLPRLHAERTLQAVEAAGLGVALLLKRKPPTGNKVKVTGKWY